MKEKHPSRKWIETSLVIGGFLTLIAIWYIVSLILKNNGNNVLPYPHETLGRAFGFLFSVDEAGRTWVNMGWTLWRLIVGYGVSFALAAILGTLAGLFPYVRRFLMSWVGVMKVIPTAAVVIILIGIFFGPQNKGVVTYVPAMLTFIIAFPIIYEGFVKGIREEDPALKDALKIDSAKYDLRTVWRIHWPLIRPYIILSLVTSLGMSMKVTVMSEVLTASSTGKLGIGGMIMTANMTGTVEDVIAYSWIAVVMMLVLDIPWFIVKYKNSKKLK